MGRLSWRRFRFLIMYFNAFPTIKYDPTGSGYTTEIKDIMTRVAVKKWVRDKAAAFTSYSVPNGSTPEMVAFYLYNDVEYHWVILMFNEIIDSYYGWPLGTQDLQRFVESKYVDPGATHHYEITQTSGDTRKKIKVMSTVPGATAVTNYEYEEKLNENKMLIRVLRPTYLSQFIREFTDLVREKK